MNTREKAQKLSEVAALEDVIAKARSAARITVDKTIYFWDEDGDVIDDADVQLARVAAVVH